MKWKHIFAVVLSCAVGVLASEPLNSARDELKSKAGTDKIPAQQLLEAIESGSQNTIRDVIQVLVKNGHSNIVAISLEDSSDLVKLEAARALSNLREKGIAERLLRGYGELRWAVIGGTQEYGMRQQARAVFEEVLSRVTGVKVDPKWTMDQKAEAFAEGVKAMGE